MQAFLDGKISYGGIHRLVEQTLSEHEPLPGENTGEVLQADAWASGSRRRAGQRVSMATDFTAIDLETANPGAWSICQIGVAEFLNGELAQEWMTYIDPEERFNRG